MEAQEIFEVLKSRLPYVVRELRTETASPCIVIEPAHLLVVMTEMRDNPALRFDLLQLVTGVDWRDRFEVVYHLASLVHGARITLKAVLARDDPHIPSVAAIYPAANWHERETYDLLGIVFDGHPNLRRILLPDDWEGCPLRRDYVFPEFYHGVSNKL